MPQVCAKHLPGKATRRSGCVYEEGHDLPVGMSKRHHQGIDKTFLNCAVCHASTVRDAPNAEAAAFTSACRRSNSTSWGSRNSFSTAPRTRSLPPSSSCPRRGAWRRPAGEDFDLLDRYVVYPVAVALMRERLLTLAGRFAFVVRRPGMGPGTRRHVQLGQGAVQLPDARPPARRDECARRTFPSIWLQEPRKGMQLHWDGNNTMVEERNKSAAFGTGHDSADARCRQHRAHRSVAADEGAAEVSATRSTRPRPRAAPRSTRSTAPRCHGASGRDFSGRIRRQGDADRRDRHRPAPARLVHLRSRGQPVDALRRLSVALCAFPQDLRLRQHAARRRLAARAVICTTARSRRCATCSSPRRSAPPVVLSRQRRLRPGEPRLRLDVASEGDKTLLQVRHAACPAIRTPDTRASATAPSCRRPTRTRWSSS